MDPASPTYQDQLARWGDDREPELIATSIILIIATCLATALRFWAQRSIKKQWEADNIISIFAAVFAIAVTVSSIVGALASSLQSPTSAVAISDTPIAYRNGVGKHMSAYSLALLQTFCLGLIKLSILLFYRRIFTMHRRAFQIAFYVLGTYTLLLTIATFFVFLLQCLPISLFWEIAYRIEGVQPPHPVTGHCLPQQAHIIPTLIANTLSDVALMVLPAIGLWNLSLPTAKKIGLFFVFSLGAFVTVVGVIRVVYGFKVTFDADVPWVNADLVNWTAVECCVGTVCASLPPMAPLLKHSPQRSSHPSTRKIWSSVSLPPLRWRLWESYRCRSHSKSSHEEDEGTILRGLRVEDRKGPVNYERAMTMGWVV
ncbi:MAG: hypothetical protein Q9226_005733 [Calogaya cf. arnoldii]